MKSDVYEIYLNGIKELSDQDYLCLYIDLPLCRSVCDYCIYHSNQYDPEIYNIYVKGFLKELEQCTTLFLQHKVDSIYFGGGTPSLWDPNDLLKLKEYIPFYDEIKMKKAELHPFDLNDDLIDFWANQMKLDVASLGVQSFHKEACLGQKRLFASQEKVQHIVKRFQKQGVRVNIDLVDLFNGDTEEDWKIFEEDMQIACQFVKPDIITSIPNYKTKLDYLSQIPRFRKILTKNCIPHTSYYPRHKKMLSLEPKDIEKYGLNDHWIATLDYWNYERSHLRYSSTHPGAYMPEHQMVIALGGLKAHKVYGYTLNGQCVVYSSYDLEKEHFHYRVVKH